MEGVPDERLDETETHECCHSRKDDGDSGYILEKTMCTFGTARFVEFMLRRLRQVIAKRIVEVADMIGRNAFERNPTASLTDLQEPLSFEHTTAVWFPGTPLFPIQHIAAVEKDQKPRQMEQIPRKSPRKMDLLVDEIHTRASILREQRMLREQLHPFICITRQLAAMCYSCSQHPRA